MACELINQKVVEASLWFAATPRDQIEGRIIPALREKFDLTAREAVEALRQGSSIKARSL